MATNESQTQSIDPLYACFWTDACQGQHELCDCHQWREQLKGHINRYFSDDATYQTFQKFACGTNLLAHNPTGCTLLHLLIYTRENDITRLLFVVRMLKHPNNATQRRSKVLALPSANPFRRNWLPFEVAQRALRSVTQVSEILDGFTEDRMRKFYFSDANSIYPIEFSADEGQLLTERFQAADNSLSIYWASLTDLRTQIGDFHQPQISFFVQGQTLPVWGPLASMLNEIERKKDLLQFLR